MKLKIKEEYLDMAISHPMTGRFVALRFLDKEEYKILFDKGLEIIFEIEEEKKKIVDKNTDN